MIYILKTMSGDSYEISGETRDKLILAGDGLLYIQELDLTINSKTITTISPKQGSRAKDFFEHYKPKALTEGETKKLCN